jgi:hypothetical protein
MTENASIAFYEEICGFRDQRLLVNMWLNNVMSKTISNVMKQYQQYCYIIIIGLA